MNIPETITDPARRYEFVFLFDVTNGNPNGDPDADNLPRVDPQTMHGIVTDVCLKRKVRDYLQTTRGTPIFIQSAVALNTLKAQAAERLAPALDKDERAGKKPIPRLREQLCRDYYDIRMFGAVLGTGQGEDRLNAGQVRGPVQLTFASSIDPVYPMAVTITRQGRTTEERMETGTTEMGNKKLVPYGLYRAQGFYNPFLAEQTGVAAGDLEALWVALANMFEFDRAAGRGLMVCRGLYVFSHNSKLGCAPAHKLFELVTVPPHGDVPPARQFADYTVAVEVSGLPEGVELVTLVG